MIAVDECVRRRGHRFDTTEPAITGGKDLEVRITRVEIKAQPTAGARERHGSPRSRERVQVVELLPRQHDRVPSFRLSATSRETTPIQLKVGNFGKLDVP